MSPAGRTRSLGCALALLVVAQLLAPTSSSAGAGVVKSRLLAPGVRYEHIKQRKPRQHIHVVSVKLDAPSALRVALGSGELPGWETTSSMSRRRGAIVAINGDYGRPSGRPVMTFARDGRLDQTALVYGRNFAVEHSESRAYIGHPQERVSVYAIDAARSLPVGKVNAGKPGHRQIAMYTPAGSPLERPPRRTCSVRLGGADDSSLSADGLGVERVFEVERVACGWARMAVKGGAVLSAPLAGTRRDQLLKLLPGQRVRLAWSVGWSGVRETVGGNPTLLEKGKLMVGASSHPFFMRNPRTGVGTTPDGRVLLVTVDGRRPRYSVGMTLQAFGRLFRSLGATWALNLDGGGSTTMVVNGRVVNRPSDGAERPVSSALLVVPARRAAVLSAAPVPPAINVWSAVRTDPASTAGLAAALRRGGRNMPRSLAGAARALMKK